MTTADELHRLESEGTPPDAKVWVTHFFSHFNFDEPVRAAFREAVRAGGFGTPGKFTAIGSDEEMEGDGFWHHWAFTVVPARPDELERLNSQAEATASAHGVRYDGWIVQRNQVTGRPVPVESR